MYQISSFCLISTLQVSTSVTNCYIQVIVDPLTVIKTNIRECHNQNVICII